MTIHSKDLQHVILYSVHSGEGTLQSDDLVWKGDPLQLIFFTDKLLQTDFLTGGDIA